MVARARSTRRIGGIRAEIPGGGRQLVIVAGELDRPTSDDQRLEGAVMGAPRPTAAAQSRAAEAAIRARRTGCDVTLLQLGAIPAVSALRASLQAAGIGLIHAPGPTSDDSRVVHTLRQADAVALLPGGSTFLTDRVRSDSASQEGHPAAVWTGVMGQRAPAMTTLTVICEPTTPTRLGPVPKTGYIARLTAHARSFAAPNGKLAMWLSSGGFLFFEDENRTSIVPCRPPAHDGPAFDVSTVTSVVAAMLDADRDIVAALEATTLELVGPSGVPSPRPTPIAEVIDAQR